MPPAPLVLDLLRHAEAAASGPDGDASRPLSPAGRRTLRALSRLLAEEGWRPTRAFASPLRRARDTARLLVSGLVPRLEVGVLDQLAPEEDPGALAVELERRGLLVGHLLLVTHLPLVERLCVRFTGGAAGFAPATLCRIEFTAGAAAGAGRLTRCLRPREDA
ncbi:MAG: hypothetical protein A2V63_06090 [Candidatus Eisenbacteria bacterium RBG_19FT_COMBO_70_11]|nr:MAG: hypothetical protein A2V63_06090 [Candidatus Eisenbacteria bacterium RBG_19FT_COMBO_70_11]